MKRTFVVLLTSFCFLFVTPNASACWWCDLIDSISGPPGSNGPSGGSGNEPPIDIGKG